MITFLSEDYTAGSGAMTIRDAVITANQITVTSQSNIKGTLIKDLKQCVVFNVGNISGNTLSSLTVHSGIDRDFSVGALVIPDNVTSIKSDPLPEGDYVRITDRFDNPDFITQLSYEKIVGLSLNSSSGANSLVAGEWSIALGASSFAFGSNAKANGDYCFATGLNCEAGRTLIDCLISGSTITVEGENLTSYFYGGGPVAFLFEDNTTLLATVVGPPELTDGNTIFTINETISDYSTGKVVATDANVSASAQGEDSKAIGSYSFASGYGCISQGQSSHAEGRLTQALGDFSHAEGYDTTALYDWTHSSGSQSSAYMVGQYARAAGQFSTRGDAQYSYLILKNQTFNDSPSYLNPVIGPLKNRTYFFNLEVVGRAVDGSGHAVFRRQGLAKCELGIAALVGTVQTIGTDINTPSWSAAVEFDADTMLIAVTGQADLTVRWVGRIEFIEVG